MPFMVVSHCLDVFHFVRYILVLMDSGGGTASAADLRSFGHYDLFSGFRITSHLAQCKSASSKSATALDESIQTLSDPHPHCWQMQHADKLSFQSTQLSALAVHCSC